ncbi:C40 family peptidase [Amnibacterium endophyticum]|uniref:C40 family peptidase n=1 Tax=Amnibacterium endophyticum TaxID=2109337 RepID=A0ABW4LHH7_9MICO
MSIADVTQQISDIQGRLALLSSSPATSVDGGAGFASALSGATATTGASSVGTALNGSGVTGDDVVKAALQYQGVPYVLGGESKSGIDCSGLVQASFKSLGVDVPRLVHQQQTIGQAVPSLKDAKPGDLIVLNGGDHIAIWMGDGKAIHAPYPGRTVSVQKAWFDDSDITTIRRVVPATADASSGTVSALGAATAGGLTASGLAQASALVGMYGAASGDSGAGALTSMLGSGGAAGSLPALLPSYGASGSSGTAQQLLAARAALVGS